MSTSGKIRIGAVGLFVVLAVFFSPLRALSAERPPRREAPETKIARDLRAGEIGKSEALLNKTRALFKYDDLPAAYRSGARRDMPKTSATPRLLQILKEWNRLPEEARALFPKHLRPDADRSAMLTPRESLAPGAKLAKIDGGDAPDSPPYQYTYTTTNFIIHYSTSGAHALQQTFDNNTNSIPDMVELAGSYMEATATWLSDHGYRMPPDFATHYYNVYFEDCSVYGAWGYCMPLDSSNHARSYISLTTDFSGEVLPNGTELDAVEKMCSTSTHEFFHACQFNYDLWEDNWWMEACSVWLQDQVGPEWDAVNDYTGWVWYFLYYPEDSIDAVSNNYRWYEDVLWAIFLQEHVDPDGSIIREIWEACDGPTNAMQATSSVLSGYLPGGFEEAYKDFLVANYEMDYSEAAEFPEAYGNLWIDQSIYTYPVYDRQPTYYPQGLGANYIRMRPTTTPGLSLSAVVDPVSAGNWFGILVGDDGGSYTRVDSGAGVAAVLGGFTDDMDEAILIASPMIVGDENYKDYNFSAYLTVGDGAAPSPNPMTFSTAPYATSNNAVSMTASLAEDVTSPPVYYRFTETARSYATTAWQASRTLSPGGLETNTLYAFRVQARDSAVTPNETLWSSIISVYTLANTPGAPTLSNPSPTRLYITLDNGDGNPSHTEYAVYNATDGGYVGADGSPAPSAYWADMDTWNSIRISDLNPSTAYTFGVKARNGDGIETVFSDGGTGTTLAADTTPPQVGGLAIVPTWIKESLTTSALVTATASDMSTGGSNIVAAEYFIGADPGEDSGTAIAASDGAFDSPLELVSTTISTTGWTIASSPYDLYVRARDEAGYWGTPTHLEITVVDGIAPNAITDLAAAASAPGIETPVSPTFDSVSSETAGHEGEDAVDANTSSYWASDPSVESTAETIQFAVADTSYLSKITLHTSSDETLFPAHFKIKLYDDGAWYTVVSEYDYTATAGANTWQFGARKAAMLAIEIVETPQDAVSGLYTTEVAEVVLYTDSGGSRAVDLSWSAPADTGPSGRAAEYTVKYSLEEAPLAASFTGTAADSTPPVPGAAGTPETQQVAGLDPGTTLYFAVVSTDDYDNDSAVSNIAAVTTLADPNPYIALDTPTDGEDLDVPTPPTFAWHANIFNTFKVQVSNVPSFPTRPYKDSLGRLAKKLTFGVRRGQTTFTPTTGQWKAIKKLAASMDGTLYWRIEGRATSDRLLGVAYSEVYSEYGFDSGVFSNLTVGPFHDDGGQTAVWPNNRPQFSWEVSNPIYSTFYLEFAATSDINSKDRRNVYVVTSRNGSATWLRPVAGQWKQIKRRFAGVNNGLIYWRVKGMDADRAFTAASEAAPLLIDTPVFNLRDPGPRNDGTVHPEEAFVLEWGLDAEGYNRFQPQISSEATFPRGPGTMNLRVVRDRYTCPVTAAQTKRMAKILDGLGTDTFYWRLTAKDVDNTITIISDPEEIRMSEVPFGGGS